MMGLAILLTTRFVVVLFGLQAFVMVRTSSVFFLGSLLGEMTELFISPSGFANSETPTVLVVVLLFTSMSLLLSGLRICNWNKVSLGRNDSSVIAKAGTKNYDSVQRKIVSITE